MCHCVEVARFQQEIIEVIFVLGVAAAAWRWARPTPRVMLRLYAGLGSAITIVGMALQTVSFSPLTYRLMHDDIPLKAAYFTAACLLVEVVLGWGRLPPLPVACARQKRTDRPATAPPVVGTT